MQISVLVSPFISLIWTTTSFSLFDSKSICIHNRLCLYMQNEKDFLYRYFGPGDTKVRGDFSLMCEKYSWHIHYNYLLVKWLAFHPFVFIELLSFELVGRHCSIQNGHQLSTSPTNCQKNRLWLVLCCYTVRLAIGTSCLMRFQARLCMCRVRPQAHRYSTLMRWQLGLTCP